MKNIVNFKLSAKHMNKNELYRLCQKFENCTESDGFLQGRITKIASGLLMLGVVIGSVYVLNTGTASAGSTSSSSSANSLSSATGSTASSTSSASSAARADFPNSDVNYRFSPGWNDRDFRMPQGYRDYYRERSSQNNYYDNYNDSYGLSRSYRSYYPNYDRYNSPDYSYNYDTWHWGRHFRNRNRINIDNFIHPLNPNRIDIDNFIHPFSNIDF